MGGFNGTEEMSEVVLVSTRIKKACRLKNLEHFISLRGDDRNMTILLPIV